MNRFLARAARARELAGAHPESRDALEFFAAVSELQNEKADVDAYRRLARRMNVAPLVKAPDDYFWFSRVIEECNGPQAPQDKPAMNECPACGSPPQLGVLRPQADGSALFLACALCREEWPFSRSLCPNCGEADKLEFGVTEDYPGMLTLTCNKCRKYMHLIDVSKQPQAIPEADEIAVQALDMWAVEEGFEKICQNLVGV